LTHHIESIKTSHFVNNIMNRDRYNPFKNDQDSNAVGYYSVP